MKSNFEFLNRHWSVLAQLGANAENHLYSDRMCSSPRRFDRISLNLIRKIHLHPCFP